MKRSNLSICYYPTTILFLDDEPAFLTILKELIKRKDLKGDFYENPQNALNFMNDEYQTNPFIQRCLTHQQDISSDHVVDDFNVRSVHQEIYNPHRFQEITVAVVDYSMPGMDGLSFCQQIKNNTIKKIMLTGEADESLAVKAFNELAIDQFVRKDTPDLMKVLLTRIREMQQAYFSEVSDILLNKNKMASRGSFLWLNDPIFSAFLLQLCDKHQLIEYYLMDDLGSFLLLNAQGKPHWLAVANDEMMETYYEFAKGDKADETMVQALKNKEIIPYFYTEEDFDVRPQEWQPYLHKASILEGKGRYYYAFIENSSAYTFPAKKILSYEQFLNNNAR